jgi:hypothetical protein
MSISSYEPKASYLGDGTLDEYSFDFKITKLSELTVIEVDDEGNETQRVKGDDTTYLSSVEFDAVGGAGIVTLADVLPSGYTLVLLLENEEPTQDYEFQNKSTFTLKRFELALDALAGYAQTLLYRSKQALRIHDADDEESINLQFPPGFADNADRVLQVNEDGDGIKFGPTATNVDNAEGYADAAEASAAAALVSETDAEAAAVEARYLLFDGSLTVDDTDSPVSLDNATYKDKIVFVDASNGNVTINLNAIATYDADFKVQFIRSDTSVNVVTINANGAETIDGVSSYSLPIGLTVILNPDTATNWIKKFLGLVNGGGVLPQGANLGDYLENDGTDSVWTSGIFAGFSATLNESVAYNSIREAILGILDLTYLAPQVTLSASGSGTVREKGMAVTSSTLTAAVTKRTDPIARIEFFLDGVSVDDNNPPSNTGTHNEQHSWTGSFSDNATFRVDVTDDGTSGGPTTVQSSAAFTFVYPYYHGCGAPSLTAAQVAALTKSVITSNANLNRTFTSSNGDVYYYAYPASYGALTSILDENGFETFSDWTLRTENITGLDGNPVSYRIYEFNNPVIAGSTNFTFIR